MDPRLAGGITLGLLWTDEEINGRIYSQLTHLNAPQLLGAEKKDRFYGHVFAAMHKLTATKYHVENYERLEQQYADAARRLFSQDPTRREEAFKLIFELEAFLFQVKSSLDMLAKVVSATVGDGIVSTSTYGKKGDALVKGLEQYKKSTNEPGRR